MPSGVHRQDDDLHTLASQISSAFKQYGGDKPAPKPATIQGNPVDSTNAWMLSYSIPALIGETPSYLHSAPTQSTGGWWESVTPIVPTSSTSSPGSGSPSTSTIRTTSSVPTANTFSPSFSPSVGGGFGMPAFPVIPAPTATARSHIPQFERLVPHEFNYADPANIAPMSEPPPRFERNIAKYEKLMGGEVSE